MQYLFSNRILFMHSKIRTCAHILRSQSSLAQLKPRIASVLRPPPTHITQMDNAVKVASENIGGPLAVVGVHFDLGSRYERTGEEGSCHLLEHLMFEGTQNANGKELGQKLSKVTSYIDTVANRENMGIYAICLTKNIEQVVQIFSDMVLRLQFDKHIVDDARQHALDELQQSEQNPRTILDHYMHAVAYMQTPLAQPLRGRYETVSNLEFQTLQQFHRNHIQGHRIAVVAVGDVEHHQFLETVNKHFSRAPNTYVDEIPEFTSCRYTGSYCYHREDDWPKCYVKIAFEAPGWDNVSHMSAMMVAQKLMGSWDRALETFDVSIFRVPHMVGWEDIGHRYDTFYLPYYKTGLWGNYLESDATKTEDFLQALQRNWKYFTMLANDRDVQLGKNLLRQDLMSRHSSIMQMANDLGTQVIRYGRRLPLPLLMQHIDDLEVAQFKEICHHYIYDRCPVIVAFGKTGGIDISGYWTPRWRTFRFEA